MAPRINKPRRESKQDSKILSLIYGNATESPTGRGQKHLKFSQVQRK